MISIQIDFNIELFTEKLLNSELQRLIAELLHELTIFILKKEKQGNVTKYFFDYERKCKETQWVKWTKVCIILFPPKNRPLIQNSRGSTITAIAAKVFIELLRYCI